MDRTSEHNALLEAVRCDLCGSNETEMLIKQRDLLLATTNEEFTIVTCRNCGLIYLNPRPSSNTLSRFYPSQYYPPAPRKAVKGMKGKSKALLGRLKRWVLEEYYGYPVLNSKMTLRILKRIVAWPDKVLREFKGCHPLPWQGQGNVLDVGCGAGGNLRVLEEQGWKVFGIEISDIAAAHARQLVTGTIHTGTLESAPFEQNTFDLVLMNHSLEHFPSPVDALRRAYRLLKDDGLLVVSVPNARALEVKLFGWWWFGWDPPRHFYHFNKSTLSRALRLAGFQIHRHRTGTGALFLMASLDRLFKERFHREVPFRSFTDVLVARPLALIAGHLGYGTDMTVYARKQLYPSVEVLLPDPD
jgi:SAM-dependent methyltransferase